MVRVDLQGSDQVGPGKLTGCFQPPQWQQVPVIGIQPPCSECDLAALTGQSEPGQDQIDGVRARVGHIHAVIQG